MNGVQPHSILSSPSLASGEWLGECEAMGDGRGERKRRMLKVRLDISNAGVDSVGAHYLQSYE